MIVDVRDDFIAQMRENTWKRCPSALKLTGITVDELLHGIPRPCRLRSLSLIGDINHLELSIDYIVSYCNVLESLESVCYHCSPVPTGVSVLAYACTVTDIESPLHLAQLSRSIHVFLRIPVKQLVGEGHTLHRVNVELSLCNPDASVMTFYPVLRGNFI